MRAAAPKRRIIGGAGTGTPPLELEEEPPLDEALDAELADEALEAELAELPLELLVDPDEPKLLEPLLEEELLALLALLADEAELPEEPLLPEEPEDPEDPEEPEEPLLP